MDEIDEMFHEIYSGMEYPTIDIGKVRVFASRAITSTMRKMENELD